MVAKSGSAGAEITPTLRTATPAVPNVESGAPAVESRVTMTSVVEAPAAEV